MPITTTRRSTYPARRSHISFKRVLVRVFKASRRRSRQAVNIVIVLALVIGLFPGWKTWAVGLAQAALPPIDSGSGAASITSASAGVGVGKHPSTPLSFEPNAGQVDPTVHFIAHSPGGTLMFLDAEVVLVLSGPDTSIGPNRDSGKAPALDYPPVHRINGKAVIPTPTPGTKPDVARMRFIGANSPSTSAVASAVRGETPLPGKVNYLRGNDPSKWQTNLPTYKSIRYSAFYPGTDLVYDGADGNLKGTYQLEAGADPALIRWQYEGSTRTSIDAAGNLQVTYPASAPQSQQAQPKPDSPATFTVTEQAPLVWQIIGDQKVPVLASYRLGQDGVIRFEIGKYNHTLPLTIDPSISYSTYWGGSGNDVGNGVAVDGAGNAYVIGTSNFPMSWSDPPTADVRITKLSADGSTALFTTYLGGSYNDYGYSIALDAGGDIYVSGTAQSSDFPTFNAYQPTQHGSSNAFITRLAADGSALVYSTYLGVKVTTRAAKAAPPSDMVSPPTARATCT
ncbi:MAG: SBBP repeat-containing protein [Chloroflexi bacterium]|nr:SBBP repeat-containing protein [Chloroflexota bacterium]